MSHIYHRWAGASLELPGGQGAPRRRRPRRPPELQGALKGCRSGCGVGVALPPRLDPAALTAAWECPSRWAGHGFAGAWSASPRAAPCVARRGATQRFDVSGGLEATLRCLEDGIWAGVNPRGASGRPDFEDLLLLALAELHPLAQAGTRTQGLGLVWAFPESTLEQHGPGQQRPAARQSSCRVRDRDKWIWAFEPTTNVALALAASPTELLPVGARPMTESFRPSAWRSSEWGPGRPEWQPICWPQLSAQRSTTRTRSREGFAAAAGGLAAPTAGKQLQPRHGSAYASPMGRRGAPCCSVPPSRPLLDCGPGANRDRLLDDRSRPSAARWPSALGRQGVEALISMPR